MSNTARLLELLGRWEKARDEGRELTPEQLCPEDPDLARELGKRLQVLHTISNQVDTGEASNRTEKAPPRVATTVVESDLTADAILKLDTEFTSIRLLSRGGIGLVYVASDSQLHREVAVKFMREREADLEEVNAELLREAEITGKLEHPGVVPVYGLGRGPDGRPFYVMRFIRGESLEAAIARYHRQVADGLGAGERNMEFRALINRIVSVCNTVAYAHNRGILHRDIKPENVMLGKYGETLLVDWGLAMPVDRDQQARASGEKTLMVTGVSQSGNAPGVPVGTPAYMSPEQAEATDALTPATDTYSLGATLYKLLTGELPCKGKDVFDMLKRVREGVFPRPKRVDPTIPAELDAICMKAMARRPIERYAGPLDLAADLERWLADEPVSVKVETRTAKFQRWTRRNKGIALAAGVGLTAALLFAVLAAIWQARIADKETSAREASLQLAAKFAARMMAAEIDLRFRILESEAADPKLVELMTAIDANPGDRAKWGPLNDWILRKHMSYQKIVRTGSWFIDDKKGVMLALSGGNDNFAQYLGKNFAYRDYFNGLGKDQDKSADPAEFKPIAKPHLSTVIRAVTDKKLKVAFSVPIRKSRDVSSETLGVLVMTTDVGDFTALQTPMGQNQMAVLVDTRHDFIDADERFGLILHHKRLVELRREGGKIENFRVSADILERFRKIRQSELVADQEDLPADQQPKGDNFEPNYNDPITAGGWMAAFEPIYIKGRSDIARDTGWIVVVQGKN